MKYLFFGGAPSTGKTGSITRLTDKLINEYGYTIIEGFFPNNGKDFQCIIEKDWKKVLIHTYTDNHTCINAFFNFYAQHKDVDTIIISIRDEVDYMRKVLWDRLSPTASDHVFEIPLGKVRRGDTRNDCLKWYSERIDKIALQIIKIDPFILL
jgi:hypothetical protein